VFLGLSAILTRGGEIAADARPFVLGLYIGPYVVPAVLLGLAIAIPLAAGSRRLVRTKLQAGLKGLPTDELAAVLLQLQNEQTGDTRKIAAALIREFDITQPGPHLAWPSAGCGMEPRATERRNRWLRMPKVGDKRLYFLQDDIVEAGEAVQTLRRRVLRTTLVLLMLPAVLMTLSSILEVISPGSLQTAVPWPETLLYVSSDLGRGLFIAVPIGLALAIPLAAGSRLMRRSKLRRDIKGASTVELAALLHPLRNETTGDTRKIAASLMRELGVTDTELVPSEPAPGSGTEPTPSPPSPS
jgi:hypothetical protein